MLRAALVISLVAGMLVLSTLGASAKRGVLPYVGTITLAGQSFTGQAELKFVIVDRDVVLWSNDTVDPQTGQPRTSVLTTVSNGSFHVVLGSSPMLPLDADEVAAHPTSTLRVWISTGGPFELLSDQAVASARTADVPSAMAGVPSAVWSLQGNRGSNPPQDFLGTTDQQPLVLKTSGQAGLTLQANGAVDIARALHVGGNAVVDSNLNVAGNMSTAGALILNGPLALTGNARIGGDLVVSGQAAFASDAHVSGPLTVDGISHISGVLANAGVLQTDSLAVRGGAACKALTISGGADLAEPFGFSCDENTRPEPGTVMSIDPNHPGALMVTARPYDKLVAGVLSGAHGIEPGLVMRSDNSPDPEHTRNLAMSGRVYVRATAANGPIRPGDLLTSSAYRGHAMRATNLSRARGAVIGKAMSPLERGDGFVLLLVQPQ